MKTIAYKLLRREKSRLISYSAISVATVEYKVGELVRPTRFFGPLACFDTLRHALEFFIDDFPHHSSYWSLPWDKFALYECEIEPAFETLLWIANADGQRTGGVWDLRLTTGAIAANTVILTKEIPYDESMEELLPAKYQVR